MAVYRAYHIPLIRRKTLGGVVGKPRINLAIDADAVVVVQSDEFVQLPRTGQSAGFVADAFHQAAITHKDESVVIDDMVFRAVEFSCQEFFSQGKTHGIRDALPQRACGGFYAWGDAVLGVASGFAMQLAEVFQLAHGQVVTREMQKRINQHRAVTVRQHKAIAVCPMGVVRVVLEVAAPQRHCHIGHAHRRAGVA